jgi:hypothetical protein
MQHPLPQQVELGPTIHLALDQRIPRVMCPSTCPLLSARESRGGDGCFIASNSRGKRPQFRKGAGLRFGEPVVERLSTSVSHHAGERLSERDGWTYLRMLLTEEGQVGLLLVREVLQRTQDQPDYLAWANGETRVCVSQKETPGSVADQERGLGAQCTGERWRLSRCSLVHGVLATAAYRYGTLHSSALADRASASQVGPRGCDVGETVCTRDRPAGARA